MMLTNLIMPANASLFFGNLLSIVAYEIVSPEPLIDLVFGKTKS